MSTLQISPDSPSFASSPVAAGFVYSIPPTDGELLARFTRRGDTAAFAELVELHAPLVLSVCRQVLRRPADVDDAFQATFMILAKRAGDIRASDSAAGWLYRVAYRTSVALARRNKSRPEEPLNGHDFPSPERDPFDRIHEQHSVAVMIEELRALPARYQEPLVLCYLEGHSRSRAAEMLDATTATIKGRLARAKQLLRHRLARRGVALSIAAGIASSMVESAHATTSSTTLAAQTAHAASQFIGSTTATTTSSSAVAYSLAHQGVSAMLYASLAKPALAAIAVLAIGAGTVLATDAAKDSPAVAIGGVTLQASAASDANDKDETASVAIEAPRPPAPPVDVTTRVNVASPIPPNAITIQADASDMTDTTVAQPIPAAPTVTVSGMASDTRMGAPLQPPMSQWNSGPTQFGGFVDVARAQPAEGDQASVEELQLEQQYWETRGVGLFAKAETVREKYERIKALREKDPSAVTDEEWEDLNILVGESYTWRADSFLSKAKVLEMKRKIAAREKQTSAASANSDRVIHLPSGFVPTLNAPAAPLSPYYSGTPQFVPAQPASPVPYAPYRPATPDSGPTRPTQASQPANVRSDIHFQAATPSQPAELRLFWQSNLDAALDIAKRDGRKVVVHFMDPTRDRSTKLLTMVEGNPEIKKYLVHRAVPVKIDTRKQPELAERLESTKLPTVCIFAPDGELLEKFTAPQQPQDYLIKLEQVESPPMRIQVQGLPAPQPYNPGPVRSQDRYGQPLPSLHPIQPQPPIEQGEIIKLKQELDALRQQHDQLVKELKYRKDSIEAPIAPSADNEELSESEEEEEEVNEEK